MIVRDQATIQKYIPVNSSLQYDTLNPFIKIAERKQIKSLIGTAQYAVFDVATAPADVVIKEAYELCQEAIVFFAIYNALPTLAVQITESGIFSVSNTDANQSTDKQFKELQRSYKRQAHETLDEMLKFMEKNIASFPAWAADDSYKSHSNLLVNSTAIFNKHFHIFDSRQTFIALKPEIKTVEKQFIQAPIQKALLTALKEPQTNASRKEVKELLQQAIVCFTISKVAENGMYVLGAEGMHVRFDVLPYERVNTNVNLKINDFLVRTRINKASEGEQYLKEAMKIITENTDDFPEYTAPEEVAAKSTVHKTDGITLI